MTKVEAQWLLHTFQPRMNGTINQSTISMFTKAINILRNTDQDNPSCGCQYKVQAQIAKSLFEQYKSEIESVANG